MRCCKAWEAANRDTELHAVLRVLDGLVVHRAHDTYCLCTNRERRLVDDLAQHRKAFVHFAQHRVAADLDAHQLQLRCLLAVDGFVSAALHTFGCCLDEEQRDAVLVRLLAGCACRDDEQIRGATIQYQGLVATQAVATAIGRGDRGDVIDVVARLWFGESERGL